MKSFRSHLPYATGSLVILVLVILLVISAGCTQQDTGTSITQSGVKVTQPDDSHIVVAFIGEPGMEDLVEMEVTVTNSSGKSLTLSKGSRADAPPLPKKSTISFTGSYSGRDHVLVTGWFVNQSNRTLVDTGI